jgi:cellulose biosynthesis protein BcsQ
VDSRLQNAQWENRPVLDYAGSARISKEYRALTKEILKRCV